MCRPSWRRGDTTVAIALQWQRDQLLKPSESPWPYVGVRVDGASARLTASMCSELGTVDYWEKPTSRWPRWRWVKPATAGVEPEALAADCCEALVPAWNAFAVQIDRLLAGETG